LGGEAFLFVARRGRRYRSYSMIRCDRRKREMESGKSDNPPGKVYSRIRGGEEGETITWRCNNSKMRFEKSADGERAVTPCRLFQRERNGIFSGAAKEKLTRGGKNIRLEKGESACCG